MSDRNSEPMYLGGLYWRLTEPGPSTASRLYDGIVLGAGPEVVKGVLKAKHQAVVNTVTAVAAVEPENAQARKKAETFEATDHKMARALELLRGAHLGRVVAQADYTTILEGLAPLLPGMNVEQLAYWQEALLYECHLQAAETAAGPWGPGNQLERQHAQGQKKWLAALNSVKGLDMWGFKKLALWAFLFLATPSSAGLGTSR